MKNGLMTPSTAMVSPESSALRGRPSLTIAYFLEGMSASGVDTSTQILADTMRRQGHRVVQFMPWKERCNGGDMVAALPALRVSTRQPVYWTYPVSPKIFERFQREQSDLIHVHTSTTVNLLAWQISRKFRLPVVHTYHTMSTEYAHYLGRVANSASGLVNSVIRRLDKIVCDRADVVVAPSRKAGDYLKQLGVRPPVHLIPNGIDLHSFRVQTSNFLRRQLGISDSSTILLCVGRLNQEKRPLMVYEACRSLLAERADFHLVFVGDGALRLQLEQRIEQDLLQNRVHLAGLIPYELMPQVFNSADVWLSASRSEVHPMVAIEASACGLPAIVWRDPALDGVVTDGVNGFVVDSQTDFGAAIRSLIDDEQLRSRMGEMATLSASAYRVETTAARMLDLYRSVLAGKYHRLPTSPSHSLHPLT